MADAQGYLDQDSNGNLWIVTRDEQGNDRRTAADGEQALAFLNGLIAEWGPDHIPKQGSATETVPRSLVQDWLVHLALRVQQKTGKTPELYQTIKRTLTDSDAIRLFTSDPRIAPVARDIWPNLDAVFCRSSPETTR